MDGLSLVPWPLRRGQEEGGEGGGRPSTHVHCMRMRHHSPDFGESDYVCIYCLYTFTDAFTVNILFYSIIIIVIQISCKFVLACID